MVRSLPTLPLSGHCPPGVLPERNSNLPAWTELTKLAAGAWSAGNVMFNCFSRASAPLPCARAVPAAVRTKMATPAMLMRFSCHHSSSRPIDRCKINADGLSRHLAPHSTIAQQPECQRRVERCPAADNIGGISSAAVVFRPRTRRIAHLVRPEIGFVMSRLHLATRRRTLRTLAAVPYLL